MTSLATWLETPRTDAQVEMDDPFEIRAFPCEDIFFWTKNIDNSRVEQRRDPRFLGRVWRMVTAAVFVVVLGIGYGVPNAYRLLAGVEIQGLETELARLDARRQQLSVQYSAMRSPAVLEKRGAGRYVATNSSNDIHLPPPPDARVAALAPVQSAGGQ